MTSTGSFANTIRSLVLLAAKIIHNVYGFDTETDNDGKSAWIVQWVISDGDHGMAGRDAGSFAEALAHLLGRERKIYLYAHNLDYDIHFVKGAIQSVIEEYSLESRLTVRHGKVIAWSISASKESCYKKSELIFRDTMKKMPGSSVQSLGRMIGLPKLEGVSEDFHPGWSNDVDFADPKQWEYVKRDAAIVARAAQMMHGTGRTKSTASGDAWMLMKKFIATDKSGKRYKNDLRWQKLFPKLSTELDLRLRKGYTGGLNISPYHNRGYTRATEEAPLVHEDVHSMYPTVMSYDPLPYGIPTVMTTMPRDGALFIMECRIKVKIKEGYIPWFSFKQGFDNMLEGITHGDPVYETQEWHEMTLTNIDLDVLMDWYDVEFDPDYPNLYFVFKQKIGVFADYIKKYMKEKEKAVKNSLEYTNAKLAMNSGYGRMALARETESTILGWDKELGDYNFISEPTMNDDTENYLPYAIFVTSYARARLLENVAACSPGGQSTIHCDTDSVIHASKESPVMDHDDHLGGWGIESRPIAIYEGGFKRYFEILKEPIQSLKDFSMACAGVPQRVKEVMIDGKLERIPTGMWLEIIDDPSLIGTHNVLGQEHYCIKSQWIRDLYNKAGMNPDDVSTMKLIPVKVPGGVILESRQHTLTDNLVYRLRR